MSETVDARGLSCPQPVLLTINQMKKMDAGRIEILVDTEVSKENVSRAAMSQGWNVMDVMEENMEYRIIIARK